VDSFLQMLHNKSLSHLFKQINNKLHQYLDSQHHQPQEGCLEIIKLRLHSHCLEINKKLLQLLLLLHYLENNKRVQLLILYSVTNLKKKLKRLDYLRIRKNQMKIKKKNQKLILHPDSENQKKKKIKQRKQKIVNQMYKIFLGILILVEMLLQLPIHRLFK